MHFKARAHDKLRRRAAAAEPRKFKTKFVGRAQVAIAELDDFEGTREAARAIRQRALDDLDSWLELFEAQRHGARRHGAVRADAGRGQPLVLDIAGRHGVRKIIKSKSMVSEESGARPRDRGRRA